MTDTQGALEALERICSQATLYGGYDYDRHTVQKAILQTTHNLTESILQLLTDPENQPHQFVGDPSGLVKLITALCHTYDPATHILIAREDVPEGLKQAIQDIDPEGNGGYAYALKIATQAAALIAQKLEE